MRMERPIRMPTATVSTATTRLGPPSGSRLLVIGACGGIGRAVADAAADIGLEVIAMDLAASFERRGIELGKRAIAIDLLDEQSIKAAFQQLGDTVAGLDGIAVCSGYTAGSDTIAEHDTERFDNVLSGNLRGPVLVLREAVPFLQDDASVVLLST